jgi:hypothetical protein
LWCLGRGECSSLSGRETWRRQQYGGGRTIHVNPRWCTTFLSPWKQQFGTGEWGGRLFGIHRWWRINEARSAIFHGCRPRKARRRRWRRWRRAFIAATTLGSSCRKCSSHFRCSS